MDPSASLDDDQSLPPAVTAHSSEPGPDDHMTVEFLALLGTEAHLMSYADAYGRLAGWVTDAADEVLVMTHFHRTYPDRVQHRVGSERLASTQRQQWFDAWEAALRASLDGASPVRFRRIVGIDGWEAALRDDIVAWARDELLGEPQNARVTPLFLQGAATADPAVCAKISPVRFASTFVLVDRAHLFMSVDVATTGSCSESPFVLVASDPTRGRFNALRDMFLRVWDYPDSEVLNAADNAA